MAARVHPQHMTQAPSAEQRQQGDQPGKHTAALWWPGERIGGGVDRITCGYGGPEAMRHDTWRCRERTSRDRKVAAVDSAAQKRGA
jgi:hypothetical protein